MPRQQTTLKDLLSRRKRATPQNFYLSQIIENTESTADSVESTNMLMVEAVEIAHKSQQILVHIAKNSDKTNEILANMAKKMAGQSVMLNEKFKEDKLEKKGLSGLFSKTVKRKDKKETATKTDVDRYGNLLDDQKSALSKTVDFLIGPIIPGLINGFTKLLGGFITVLFSPAGLVITAIGGAITLAIRGIKEAIETGEWTKGILQAFADLGSILTFGQIDQKTIKKGLMDTVDFIVDAFDDLGDSISDVFQDYLIDPIKKIPGIISSALKNSVAWIFESLGKINFEFDLIDALGISGVTAKFLREAVGGNTKIKFDPFASFRKEAEYLRYDAEIPTYQPDRAAERQKRDSEKELQRSLREEENQNYLNRTGKYSTEERQKKLDDSKLASTVSKGFEDVKGAVSGVFDKKTEKKSPTATPYKGGGGIDDFSKSHEGLMLNEYKDPTGRPTIGYGHLLTEEQKKTGYIELPDGTKIHYKNGITKEQAEKIFRADKDILTKQGEEVLKQQGVNVMRLDQDIRDVLGDVTFGTGAGIYKRTPKLVEALKSGNREAIAKQLEDIGTTSVDVDTGERIKLPGLVRRAKERADMVRNRSTGVGDAVENLSSEVQTLQRGSPSSHQPVIITNNNVSNTNGNQKQVVPPMSNVRESVGSLYSPF